MKGKQANGVGNQYTSILPRNDPALLPTMKTYEKLPNSMLSRELNREISWGINVADGRGLQP